MSESSDVYKRPALAQDPHGYIASMGHAPAIGLDGAGEHGQQRRLAIAVLAHDADAIALVHPERHRIEDVLRGKLEPHGIAA